MIKLDYKRIEIKKIKKIGLNSIFCLLIFIIFKYVLPTFDPPKIPDLPIWLPGPLGVICHFAWALQILLSLYQTGSPTAEDSSLCAFEKYLVSKQDSCFYKSFCTCHAEQETSPRLPFL